MALAAAALASLALAAPAPAAKNLVSIFQDDRVLTREGDARRNAALDEMKLLGVDVVKTVVNWERVAPAARSTTVPEGVDLTSPAAYAAPDWNPFDELVRAAQARGMQMMINPAGAIPDWASGCPVNTYRACLPNTVLYGQFVTAVARRYSGSYPDEDGSGLLPRVSLWTLWNEPNLNTWIEPQQLGSGKRRRRVSAKIYRALTYEGIAALRSNGHEDATILFGETAPIGAPPKRTSPVQFYRDLFCVDAKGRKLRGRAAKQLGCGDLKPFDVQGLAHHPYVKGAGPPIPAKALEGAASVGTMGGLKRVMRQGAARGLIPRKLPIWVTEFGISTNPPDTKYGVKLSRAAAYLNQVDRYFHMDRQIVSTHQFEYEDDTALATLTFQTGLRFGDGTRKPGLIAYRLPIYVTKAKKGRVHVWGWVRPASKGAQQVVVQNRRTDDGEFTNVKTAKTDRYGFLSLKTKALRGTWRLAWVAPSGEIVTSRVAEVDVIDRPPTPGASPPGPTPNPGGGPDPTPLPNPDPTNPNPSPSPSPNPNPNPSPNPNPGPTPVWQLNVNFVRTRTFPASPVSQQLGEGTVTFVPFRTACETACTHTFPDGTQVQLTATPKAGSAFTGWTGACSQVQGSTCTVQMSQARDVTATFNYTQPV